jgi:hypothetical protein
MDNEREAAEILAQYAVGLEYEKIRLSSGNPQREHS